MTQSLTTGLRRCRPWTSGLLLGLLTTASCAVTTSDKAAVLLHSDIFSDSDYIKPYQAATRTVQITENFEKIYDISVTYLSPEFQQAFAKRMNSHSPQLPQGLKVASSKMGFLVSIFSPEKSKTALEDPSLWTLMVDIDGRRKLPEKVKKLREKERWEPYFPYINRWSVEYLVLFDEPLIALDQSALVVKRPLRITLKNSSASSVMEW